MPNVQLILHNYLIKVSVKEIINCGFILKREINSNLIVKRVAKIKFLCVGKI